MKKKLTLLAATNLVITMPLTTIGCFGNSNTNSLETIYIDSDWVQNKTTSFDFANLDAVTIEKLGYDENGNSVYNLKNVKQMPETLPSQITSLKSMFRGNSNKEVANLDKWDTSNITSLQSMFEDSDIVETNIINWNVSNVTDMSKTFKNSWFNASLVNWDLSKVTNMSSMFEYSINGWPLPSLPKSSLKNMSRMFYISQWRRDDINDWDVSNVTDMSYLFARTQWHPNLSSWDVSNVTNMEGMFSESAYNDPWINDWDVSSVVNMKRMFYDSNFYYVDISNWNVSNVTTMESMFELAAFDRDLSKWSDKISKVTNASSMFKGAYNFNKDLSSWEFSEDCLLTDFATDTLDEWVNHDPSWLPKNFS